MFDRPPHIWEPQHAHYCSANPRHVFFIPLYAVISSPFQLLPTMVHFWFLQTPFKLDAAGAADTTPKSERERESVTFWLRCCDVGLLASQNERNKQVLKLFWMCALLHLFIQTSEPHYLRNCVISGKKVWQLLWGITYLTLVYWRNSCFEEKHWTSGQFSVFPCTLTRLSPLFLFTSWHILPCVIAKTSYLLMSSCQCESGQHALFIYVWLVYDLMTKFSWKMQKL